MTRPDSDSQLVLIDGRWQPSHHSETFQAENPSTGEQLPARFPVSQWQDCDAALKAAQDAYQILRQMPGEKIACFLEAYADEIEAIAERLVAAAHQETALPESPRLRDGELPRTTGQLRQAAEAARTGSWRNPIIDTQTGIRSCLSAIGPVGIFGPNNFPFAFGSISGGDFAAALAAGNPIIGKANSSHPETTRLFGEAVLAAIKKTDMPAGTVQLLYRTSHADGERLVTDPRIAATGYTGSRGAGLQLKQAADAAGKPIHLELSSCNPVVLLPGAINTRGQEIADEFGTSCLMGSGQFCTNPSLMILVSGSATEKWIDSVTQQFIEKPNGPLLSSGVQTALVSGIKALVQAGATLLTGGNAVDGPGYRVANSLLRVSAEQFLHDSETFQTELFGNASLILVAQDIDEVSRVLDHLEGNLTGGIYSDAGGTDDAHYDLIVPTLRQNVGRLLNDQMPTGVAVSPAMNHGGPFPATGSPQFSAVGIPGSIGRFVALHCYDNVRLARLPHCLKNENPLQQWRNVDGHWTQDPIADKNAS